MVGFLELSLGFKSLILFYVQPRSVVLTLGSLRIYKGFINLGLKSFVIWAFSFMNFYTTVKILSFKKKVGLYSCYN